MVQYVSGDKTNVEWILLQKKVDIMHDIANYRNYHLKYTKQDNSLADKINANIFVLWFDTLCYIEKDSNAFLVPIKKNEYFLKLNDLMNQDKILMYSDFLVFARYINTLFLLLGITNIVNSKSNFNEKFNVKDLFEKKYSEENDIYEGN
jgi:hypothetical protein